MFGALRAAVTLGTFVLLACSSDADSGTTLGNGGTSNPINVLPAGGKSTGGSGGASTSGTACNPSNASACVEEQFEGEGVPLDIYVLFDQSGSMCSCIEPAGGLLCPDPNCRKTRLDAVREATDQFLSDPLSAGIGVGLGFFGSQPIGSADCRAETYATPSVPIAPLPGNAASVMAALRAVSPTGETPTGAALRGACTYAQDAVRRTGRRVVILLLTDGKPEAPLSCMGGSGCCPTLSDAAAAASACLASAQAVTTYVLGVGPLLGNLEQIAVAGGTQHAYLVEGNDVGSEVLSALNRIRGDAAIPCRLQLPPAPVGQTLDFTRVNVEYADAECRATSFYNVASQSACADSPGWYYDNAVAPTHIELCPHSCGLVSTRGARLFYTVGCETQSVPR